MNIRSTYLIICPDCNLHNRSAGDRNDKPDEETDDNMESEEQAVPQPPPIICFDKWQDYAYHILTTHPKSERKNWAAACLQAEGLPLPEEGIPAVPAGVDPAPAAVEPDVETRPKPEGKTAPADEPRLVPKSPKAAGLINSIQRRLKN